MCYLPHIILHFHAQSIFFCPRQSNYPSMAWRKGKWGRMDGWRAIGECLLSTTDLRLAIFSKTAPRAHVRSEIFLSHNLFFRVSTCHKRREFALGPRTILSGSLLKLSILHLSSKQMFDNQQGRRKVSFTLERENWPSCSLRGSWERLLMIVCSNGTMPWCGGSVGVLTCFFTLLLFFISLIYSWGLRIYRIARNQGPNTFEL